MVMDSIANHERPRRSRTVLQPFQAGSPTHEAGGRSKRGRAKDEEHATSEEEASETDSQHSSAGTGKQRDPAGGAAPEANGTADGPHTAGRRHLPRRACQVRLAERQRERQYQHRHRDERQSLRSASDSGRVRELERLLDRSHNFEMEDFEDEGRSRYNMRKKRKEVERFQARDPSPDVPAPRRGGHARRRHRDADSGSDSAAGGDPPSGDSSSAPASPDSSTASDLSDLRRRHYRLFKKYKMSVDPTGQQNGAAKSRKKVARRMDTVGDITPLAIDKTVTWESIGGLGHHIRALKEMVVLPLLYPEVYEKFKATPPMGVLFVGPPGTGKTLMARSLANACAIGDRKVTFFMRKGADVLSKWVGESEKQLRMLFEEARRRQPSIIFFDELDGLAPVRSSRSDHTHAAIVSTLLALIDGLDSRGQVVLIGATNRVDTIDPALRRPGRFDRELLFTLPPAPARQAILQIHTKGWRPAPPAALLHQLAQRTAGYSGADLRALCVEAPLRALRRTFPQIYCSPERLLIDLSKVVVALGDWEQAIADVTPATHRTAAVAEAAPLPLHLQPCLGPRLAQLKRLVLQACPTAAAALAPAGEDDFADLLRGDRRLPFAGRCGVVVHGARGMGQLPLLRALQHQLEGLPAFTVSLEAAAPPLTDDEALLRAFTAARRHAPAILSLPGLDGWWAMVLPRTRYTLQRLLMDLPGGVPLLVIATVDREIPATVADEASGAADDDGLAPFLAELARGHRFACPPPSDAERRALWQHVAAVDVPVPPAPGCLPRAQWPALQRDPNPPRVVAPSASPEDEEQRRRHEATCLRQLRVFIRDTLLRLTNDRRFRPFMKLMDPPEQQEYVARVKKPIWLMDCLQKCNEGAYTTIQIFVEDIEAIVRNTKKFYSEVQDVDGQSAKAISKAEQLYDYVLLDISRMDGRLLGVCSRIHAERAAPAAAPPDVAPAQESNDALDPAVARPPEADESIDGAEPPDPPLPLATPVDLFGESNGTAGVGVAENEPEQPQSDVSPHIEGVAEGVINPEAPTASPSAAFKKTPSKRAAALQARNKWTPDKAPGQTVVRLPSPGAGRILSVSDVQQPATPELRIDRQQLHAWVDAMVTTTSGMTFDQLDQCYATVARIVFDHRQESDKANLLQHLAEFAASLGH